MPIVINNIGPNTKQIAVNGEQSISAIADAVTTALVALGWTLHDTVTTGANNAQLLKVYRCLNADGETYKYMGIYWWPTKGLFHTTSWESWNNVTHVGTNEVFTAGRTFPQGVQSNNCLIYVMASDRWALLLSVLRGEPGPWSGVIEFEREAVEDTPAAGMPCFAWTNSSIIGEPVGYHNSSGAQNNDSWVVSFPRIYPNLTGHSAAVGYSFLTAFGMYPPPLTDASAAAANSHGFKLGGAAATYVWDPTKRPIHTLKGVGVNGISPRGRVFGLKAVPNMGNIFETVSIKTDANGFHAVDGTPEDHLILPISGGWCSSSNAAYGASRFVGTTYGGSTAQGATCGALVKGQFVYWGGRNGGLFKTDLDSTATTQVASVGATYVTDIAYDGDNYLYCATAAGMARISLIDDSVTLLAAGTPGYLAVDIDENYIYATHRTNGIPKLDIISRATFAAPTTVNLPVGQNQAICAITVDFAGNCYTGSANVLSSTGENKVIKVVGATGAASSVNLSTYNGSGTDGKCVCLYFDGSDIWWIGSWNTMAGNLAVGAVSQALAITYPFINIGSTGITPNMNRSMTDRAPKAMPIKGWVMTARAFDNGSVSDAFLTALSCKGYPIYDNKQGLASSVHPQAGYPVNPAGQTIPFQSRNYGSFYISFTMLTTAPVCLTSGMYKAANHAGLPTAHILVPN